jgi:hypothetical protein
MRAHLSNSHLQAWQKVVEQESNAENKRIAADSTTSTTTKRTKTDQSHSQKTVLKYFIQQ